MGLDLSEKILVDYNDVFADIMNVFLYDGKCVIKEEQLENSKDITQYKADGRLHEQERDVSKYYNGKEMRIAFLRIENQNYEDPFMPLRVISYDGISYKNQLFNNYRKKQKPYPVITLVLYFGTKPWSAGKSLYEVLEIPEDLKRYVNDYTINLVEVAFLEQEQINLLQSDFKILADFLVQKRKKTQYIPCEDDITHVDELLKTLKILTGDKNYLKILKKLNKNRKKSKKGRISMCEIYDQIFQKGVQHGKEIAEKERKRADSERKHADELKEEIKKLKKLLKENHISF